MPRRQTSTKVIPLSYRRNLRGLYDAENRKRPWCYDWVSGRKHIHARPQSNRSTKITANQIRYERRLHISSIPRRNPQLIHWITSTKDQKWYQCLPRDREVKPQADSSLGYRTCSHNLCWSLPIFHPEEPSQLQAVYLMICDYNPGTLCLRFWI